MLRTWPKAWPALQRSHRGTPARCAAGHPPGESPNHESSTSSCLERAVTPSQPNTKLTWAHPRSLTGCRIKRGACRIQALLPSSTKFLTSRPPTRSLTRNIAPATAARTAHGGQPQRLSSMPTERESRKPRTACRPRAQRTVAAAIREAGAPRVPTRAAGPPRRSCNFTVA